MLVARPPMKNSRSVSVNRLREVSSVAVGDAAAGCAGVCVADGVPAWASARCGAAPAPTSRISEMNERRRMSCLPLPHEELTRWMVRAVNRRVTVHAGSTEHPVALVRGDLVLVVERRRMLAGDVTALTEHRHPDDQHAIVRRAVRVVAGGAVLAHRRVLEERRSAHLRMTGRAQLADRTARLQILDVADRAVWVMPGPARHLALAHRHVGDGAFGLGDLQAMTRGARLRLRRLDQLTFGRLRAVHAVACGAREIAPVV